MRRALVIAAALAALLVGAVAASAQSGDLRVGSPQDFESPNPFKSVEAINVESQATQMYDQLIGLKSSDESIDYGGTALAKGADVVGRRQDDHVPPQVGHPLVGRAAVHERRRALDVQRRARQQDEPVPRHDRGGQVGLGAGREHVRAAPLDARLRVPRQARDPHPAEAHLVEVPGREARQDRRPGADRDDRAVHPHEVGEARHDDPHAQRQVRHVPQRRQAARGQARS